MRRNQLLTRHYPKKIVDELEKFFKHNESMEHMDLNELSKIVNKKQEIKLTVIKNLAMAKQINKSDAILGIKPIPSFSFSSVLLYHRLK